MMSNNLASPEYPHEEVVLYEASPWTVETSLFKELLQLDPSGTLFGHHFRTARYVLAELGTCASDLVWRRALMQIEASASQPQEGDRPSYHMSDVAANDVKLTVRDIIKNWAFSMPNLDPISRGCNVTPKFLRLMEVLKACEPFGESFRGIVFVQRRAVALALGDLLRMSVDHIGFLRPRVVVGHSSFADLQLQQEIFRGMDLGTCNLLIATKSIEDLDVPKVSIVIRFDLFESQVSYVYTRACARWRESYLVHMLQRENGTHRRIISQNAQLDEGMQEWANTLYRSRGSSVPPGTLQEITDPYHSDSSDEIDELIEDPTTRGRIYPKDATTVIYRFSANLQDDATRDTSRPLFEYEEKRGGRGASRAYCTIVLPDTPIHGISGSHIFSVAHARRAACYKACSELYRRGSLDYWLFPLPSGTSSRKEPHGGDIDATVKLATERNSSFVDVETKVSGARLYPRKQPYFWTTLGSTTCLYPTVISTDCLHASFQPCASMLILTRRPLPPLGDFNIFLSGVPATIHLQQCAELRIDQTRLDELHKYTLRISRTLANKSLTCPLHNMAYFFAPLTPTWKDVQIGLWQPPSIIDHIPWHLVSIAAQTWAIPLQSDENDSLVMDIEDAVIQDNWTEFTRRYDAVTLRTDLTPMSNVLDNSREANFENILAYYKAHRKAFPGLKDYGQPIIQVSRMPPVWNRLDPISRPFATHQKASPRYLIPELCAKFTIPASTWRMAMLLPSIIRRIDDLLLVKELNVSFFNNAISEHLLHMAISTPSAGIEYDYECLELFGDAFLKYLSSIYVFVTYPAQNEGALHVTRQRIINNKTLLQSAIRAGLPQYIQSRPFSLRSWNLVLAQSRPSAATETMAAEGHTSETDQVHRCGVLVRGSLNMLANPPAPPVATASHQEQVTRGSDTTKMSRSVSKRTKKQKEQDEQTTQRLGDKAVADVVEAIIGAAYLSGGCEVALRVTKELHVPIENIDQWSDFGRKALVPPPAVTAKLKVGTIQAVENIIGHRFSRPYLLAQALTHSSTPGYESNSYQRLEFVGDAILDFMVVRYLFDREKQPSPGRLTLLKGAMVSNAALASLCIWSGLQEHIVFESPKLAQNIQAYAVKLEARQSEEYALAQQEGRSPGQYWLELEPPKALSDVVESVVGALYLSDNFSRAGADAFFDKVFKPFYDRHIKLATLSHHPTQILFELAQAQGCQQFEIVKEKFEDSIRCDVVVHDVILASAIDSAATRAARRASLSALDALEGDAQFLTRTCDCRTGTRKTTARKKEVDVSLSCLEMV